MPISDLNRARFEGIGIDLIRRDLAAGGTAYIGRRQNDRLEAEKWVKLFDAENRKQTNIVGRLTAVGLMVGFIAILASVVAFLR